MATLHETLERIQELDPELVRIVGNMYGTIYLRHLAARSTASTAFHPTTATSSERR